MGAKKRCTGRFRTAVSRARYYNPQVGRFRTADTEDGDNENPRTLHLYVYCAGDPVNSVDPSGNDFELGGLVGAMSVGFALSDFLSLGRALLPHGLITGGSPANLAKRRKIDETARKYNGSRLWDYAVKKDNFPPNSNKCNKFVYDVAKEVGAEPLVTASGTKRAPLAAEYADRSTTIPNWRPLKAGENPQPGDIAAYKLSGGGARFSGHSGLIVIGGNLSAHSQGVSGIPGQFENNPNTRYRRYTGN